VNLQFANPTALLLLWIVPLAAAAWMWSARRRETRLARLVSARMQRKLRPPSAAARAAWQTALTAMGLVLALAAAARPRWGAREETVYARGRSLIIAVDVSRSMLAADVHPSRLERAKADVLDLVRELRGDRAGLIAFRHKAALLCPLTTDYAFLAQAVDAMDIDSAPRGATDIADAILKALDAFREEEGSHRAVVLISDGEDLTGRALSAAEEAGRRGVPIFTVGLGNREGTHIPDEQGRFVTYQGANVVTRLQHETLHAIATATGGAYVPVETAGMTTVTLGTLYSEHLRRISAQESRERRELTHVERYQLFLLPAVLALLGAAFLSRGRLMRSAAPPAAPSALKDLNPPPTALRDISGGQGARPAIPERAPAPTEGRGHPSREGTVRSTSSLLPPPRRGAAAPAAAGWVLASALTLAFHVRAETNAPPPSVPAGREGGRAAQALFDAGDYPAAAAAYEQAARDAGAELRRDLRYNAAVALYEAGRFDEAAARLRDLAASDDAAGTCSALGTALYRSAEHSATNAAARAALLREAGEAFRRAARAARDPAGPRRDLDVVLDRYPRADEEARIERLMEQHGRKPAHEIAGDMLAGQRDVLAALRAAATNDSPSRVGQMERAAERQAAAADLWIPLKSKLLAENRDPDKQAVLADVIESTRDQMLAAADVLRDLDDARAAAAADASGRRVYEFWKSVAPYAPLLDEDLWRQTNTLAAVDAEPVNGQALREAQSDQAEARELTRLFGERFAAAVPEGGEPDGDGTNAAPRITAETRQKILNLAEQAAAAQETAAAALERSAIADARPEQRRAAVILQEIRDLLPKDRGQAQQEQPQQDQSDKSDKSDQPDLQPQEQPAEQPREQPAEKPGQPEPKPGELSRKELERLLEKALRREKEHEDELRQRIRRIPMSPSERDW